MNRYLLSRWVTYKQFYCLPSVVVQVGVWGRCAVRRGRRARQRHWGSGVRLPAVTVALRARELRQGMCPNLNGETKPQALFVKVWAVTVALRARELCQGTYPNLNGETKPQALFVKVWALTVALRARELRQGTYPNIMVKPNLKPYFVKVWALTVALRAQEYAKVWVMKSTY